MAVLLARETYSGGYNLGSFSGGVGNRLLLTHMYCDRSRLCWFAAELDWWCDEGTNETLIDLRLLQEVATV